MSAMPLELITLLSSSVMGGVMKVWSRSIEARRYLLTAVGIDYLEEQGLVPCRSRPRTDPRCSRSSRIALRQLAVVR